MALSLAVGLDHPVVVVGAKRAVGQTEGRKARSWLGTGIKFNFLVLAVT
jgi:hypothetical protein